MDGASADVSRGVTFMGYVGLLYGSRLHCCHGNTRRTGVRAGGFSISVDERDNGTLWENFMAALLEVQWTCGLVAALTGTARQAHRLHGARHAG